MSKLTETQQAYDKISELLNAEILKKGSNANQLRRFQEALDVAFYLLESVREHQAGLQSFRSMRRIDARRKNDSALRLRFSQSFASRRQRLSHAMVRSTTQRRGRMTKPLA